MKDYQDLPDIMEPDEVSAHFREALAAGGSQSETAAALFQLAQRQWHTYTPLDASLKPGLEGWIKANWDASQRGSLLNHLLSTVTTLRLEGCLPLLQQAAADPATPADVRGQIQQALSEYEEPAEVY